MNSDPSKTLFQASLTTLLLAGLAGGIAEIVWVGAYSALTPLRSTEVLRQITATVAPGLAGSLTAPALGMAIHLILSAVLAVGYGKLVWELIERTSGLGLAILAAAAALALVWTFNFLVLLPVMNPVFVDLMPYPVTLISKLLFGAAMGAVLYQRGKEFMAERSARHIATTH